MGDLSLASEKIVFVPFIDAFGGVERLIISVSRFLHDLDISHKVVCFRDSLGLQSYADWPLKIIRLDCKRQSFAEATTLKQHIYSQRKGNRPLFFDLKSAYYSGLSGIKDYTLHLTDPPSLLSNESSRFSKAYRDYANERPRATLLKKALGNTVHYLNKKGVQNAHSTIAMTKVVANEIHSLYGASVSIVRPGIAPVTLNEALPPKLKANFRILSVCRLESSKRIDSAVQAINKICNKNLLSSIAGKNAELILDIAGDGPERQQLENLVRSLNLDERINFLGRVSDSKLERLFANSQLFIMPAKQGYGLPALEAMQRRLPVVLHRESGVSEILQNTPWAEIIENVDELPYAIIRAHSKVENGFFDRECTFAVPTESEWSEAICKICGWI